MTVLWLYVPETSNSFLLAKIACEFIFLMDEKIWVAALAHGDCFISKSVTGLTFDDHEP